MKFSGTEIRSERQAKAYSRAKHVAGRVKSFAAEVAKLDESSKDELPGKDRVVLSNQTSGLTMDSRAYHWKVDFDFANLDQTDGVEFSARTVERPKMKSGFMPGFMSAPMPNHVQFSSMRSSDEGTVITEKQGWSKSVVTLDESGLPIELKNYFAGIRLPV